MSKLEELADAADGTPLKSVIPGNPGGSIHTHGTPGLQALLRSRVQASPHPRSTKKDASFSPRRLGSHKALPLLKSCPTTKWLMNKHQSQRAQAKSTLLEIQKWGRVLGKGLL